MNPDLKKFNKFTRIIVIAVIIVVITACTLNHFHLFLYAQIFGLVSQFIIIIISAIVACILISAVLFMVNTIREWRLRKLLKPIVLKYGLDYMGVMDEKDIAKYYKKFRFIKRRLLGPFEILGSFNGEEIRFFQMGLIKPYSVVMITMDRYKSNFDHIKIVPNTLLNIEKGFSLEWIEFNKKFISKLENPRQALEVLSPTFMETLVDMKEKYKEIEIECFEDKNYQTNVLVIVHPGHIFSLSQIRPEIVNNGVQNFLDFVKIAINLKESI
jgi:hypothetical protein